MPYSAIKMGILVLWSLEGIHGPCIHTLLTLTRGHSTTVRDVTGNPCERSTWSLYSLYSLDALTLTPSSRSTGTACDRLENMYTVPSITTRQDIFIATSSGVRYGSNGICTGTRDVVRITNLPYHLMPSMPGYCHIVCPATTT